jgi:hypothetical protein
MRARGEALRFQGLAAGNDQSAGRLDRPAQASDFLFKVPRRLISRASFGRIQLDEGEAAGQSPFDRFQIDPISGCRDACAGAS